MKKIYRFFADCGRQGEVESLFIADSKDVDNVIGKDVYFGEILGKHSEIAGVIEPDEVEVVTDDQEFIAKFEKLIGTGTISGHNPLDYYSDEDD